MEVIVKNRNYRRTLEYIDDRLCFMNDKMLKNEFKQLKKELTLENADEIYKKSKKLYKQHQLKLDYDYILKYIEDNIDNFEYDDKQKLIYMYNNLTLENTPIIYDQIRKITENKDVNTFFYFFIFTIVSICVIIIQSAYRK